MVIYNLTLICDGEYCQTHPYHSAKLIGDDESTLLAQALEIGWSIAKDGRMLCKNCTRDDI